MCVLCVCFKGVGGACARVCGGYKTQVCVYICIYIISINQPLPTLDGGGDEGLLGHDHARDEEDDLWLCHGVAGQTGRKGGISHMKSLVNRDGGR